VAPTCGGCEGRTSLEYQVNREPRRTVHIVSPSTPNGAAANVRQRITEGLDDFVHVVRLRGRQARLHLLKWQGDASAGVRREPRRAMLTALIVGLVLGFLLRRRQILNREEVFLG
jgi:hypothetical protein